MEALNFHFECNCGWDVFSDYYFKFSKDYWKVLLNTLEKNNVTANSDAKHCFQPTSEYFD